MGDFCMRFLTQIVSFLVWIIGTITSILSKVSPIIDDSISLLAGLIGIVGGIVWISTLALKKKENVINLENAKLENEIKKKELDNLNNVEI
jgi:membrane associated rhomboid family serine protease